MLEKLAWFSFFVYFSSLVDEVFDLFIALDANNDQLNFPVVYASGRAGWASLEQDQKGENLFLGSSLLQYYLEKLEWSSFL